MVQGYRRQLATSQFFAWGADGMCLMNSIVVKVVLIMAKFRLEIMFMPKQNPIRKFAARTADFPFHEGVTPGTIWNRLNLIDTVLFKVGKPQPIGK